MVIDNYFMITQLEEAFVCIRCKKQTKYYSKDLCKSCYNYLKVTKEKRKLYANNFKDKHPNYFKDYYQRKKVENEDKKD